MYRSKPIVRRTKREATTVIVREGRIRRGGRNREGGGGVSMAIVMTFGMKRDVPPSLLASCHMHSCPKGTI